MIEERQKIIFITVGTAGDVFPFIGIAAEMRARGFEVELLANSHFKDVAKEAGLSFVPVGTGEEHRQALAHPDLWHRRRGLKVVMNSLIADPGSCFDILMDRVGAPGVEPGRTLIVAHPFAFAARLAQEKYGVDCATLLLSPSLLRSRHRVPVLYGQRELSHMARPLKSLMWALADRLHIDPAVMPRLGAARKSLGLPPLRRPFNGWIFSPSLTIGLFPPFFAPAQPDWPEQLRLTGFPQFHTNRPVPDGVKSFLKDGPPPLVFSLGSGGTDVDEYIEVAAETCRRLGQRALFLTDRKGADRDFLFVPFAPLDKILPRAAALIHHGGIGTTAAAMNAGIPQLIRPLGFDQPDHAARIEELGLGKTLLPTDFTTPALTDLLARVLADTAMARRCMRRGEAMKSESAIKATCDLLCGALAQRPFDPTSAKRPP